MRRRRVAGRFYIFIAILLLAIFLVVRPHLNLGGGEDVIFVWNSAFEQSMDCVFIRDERVEASEAVVRVEYLAKENTEVSQGDLIANLFTTGYSESLLKRLEETRQNIQAYHKTLLGTIVDNTLDRLDTIIDMTAVDFKNLATQQTRGNLLTVVEQLETAMVNRQEYLRQNKRDDTRKNGIYRIVDQDRWYTAILADANSWNPVVDQSYYLKLEGFEDLVYTATVTSVQKSSGTVLAIFEIDQPVGPLIYQRTGRATLSIELSSIAVHTKALYSQNGQIGIWVYDVPGGTFVPVEVLSTDGDIALIQATVDGVLQPGQRVLIK